MSEIKMKERIEKFKKKFGVTPCKYLWDSNIYTKDYSEWYLFEFGKYCYLKGIKDGRKNKK